MFTTLLLGSARGTPWTYLHVHVSWIKLCIYVYYVECGATEYIYICISGYGNKMDKISITKMAYIIYVASCFWSWVKQRGHPLSEYLFKVSVPSYRHFCEVRSVERFQMEKKYSFPKRRCCRVYSRRYTDYFIVIINFHSDDLNFC